MSRLHRPGCTEAVEGHSWQLSGRYSLTQDMRREDLPSQNKQIALAHIFPDNCREGRGMGVSNCSFLYFLFLISARRLGQKVESTNLRINEEKEENIQYNISHWVL